jgi:hypothetical protein
MAAQLVATVATNFTYLQSNPRGKRGLDFVSLMHTAWDWLFTSPNPMVMYPEDAAEVLRYQARRDRLRLPNPMEGQAEAARTCFFLRQFGEPEDEGQYSTHGIQEFWSIDTEKKEITRLAFFAKWEGHEIHFDLEIGTPKP